MRTLALTLAVALAAPAFAQTQGEPRPDAAASRSVDSTAAGRSQAPAASRGTVAVPLPNGPGVFYYRAGSPGGVRIQSRRRASPALRVRPTEPASAARSAARPRASRVPSDGLTRLDLLELEENLLRAIDRRLAALDPGYRRPDRDLLLPRQAPVIVLPAAPAQPSGRPDRPAVGPPETEVAVPEAEVTVEQVERELLDLGLFRVTRVLFGFGESALLPTAERTLDVVGDVLARYPDLSVEVGGHTDAISSQAFNLALSQRRAEAVRSYLLGRFPSIRPGRITAVGYGKVRPVASNETETGRALNRRVEFRVVRRP